MLTLTLCLWSRGLNRDISMNQEQENEDIERLVNTALMKAHLLSALTELATAAYKQGRRRLEREIEMKAKMLESIKNEQT